MSTVNHDASFRLLVVTPEKIIFSGKVDEITLSAHDGSRGIQKGHAPMVGLLDTGPLRYRNQDSWNCIVICKGGFFQVENDPPRIAVLAETAEKAEEIDIDRARKAKKRAEKRILGEWSGDWNMPRAYAALQRALTRINVAGQ